MYIGTILGDLLSSRHVLAFLLLCFLLFPPPIPDRIIAGGGVIFASIFPRLGKLFLFSFYGDFDGNGRHERKVHLTKTHWHKAHRHETYSIAAVEAGNSKKQSPHPPKRGAQEKPPHLTPQGQTDKTARNRGGIILGTWDMEPRKIIRLFIVTGLSFAKTRGEARREKGKRGEDYCTDAAHAAWDMDFSLERMIGREKGGKKGACIFRFRGGDWGVWELGGFWQGL